jgi:hypothetical protein
MLFANDFSTYDKWHNKDFEQLLNKLSGKHIPFYLVTSQKDKAVELFDNDKRVNILICDGTVIKTAARVNSSYLVMQMANVKGKFSYKNFNELMRQIDALPASTGHAVFHYDSRKGIVERSLWRDSRKIFFQSS